MRLTPLLNTTDGHAKIQLGFGVAQCLSAGIVFVSGFACFGFQHNFPPIITGTYLALVAILAGLVAILASRFPHRPMLVASAVFGLGATAVAIGCVCYSLLRVIPDEKAIKCAKIMAILCGFSTLVSVPQLVFGIIAAVKLRQPRNSQPVENINIRLYDGTTPAVRYSEFINPLDYDEEVSYATINVPTDSPKREG